MIKWIKSIIKKIFRKTKTTSERLREGFDEEQKALELEEIVEEPVVEKIQCNTHSRFKKSCPVCVEAAK